MTDNKDQNITEAMLKEAIMQETHWKASEFQIKGFQVRDGATKGDNYSAIVKAIKIQAKKITEANDRLFHYMAKCMPSQQFRANWLRDSRAFEVETNMYTKVLPALKKVGGQAAGEISFPEVYYADIEQGIIIMENLKLKNFYMVDKVKGLNDHQIKLILKQLALLHATSYHLANSYKGGFGQFKEDFSLFMSEGWIRAEAAEMREKTLQMMGLLLEIFGSIIEEHCSSRDPKMVENLKAFCKDQWQKMDPIHAPVGKFNCIIHNDAWCNNFLFGKNEAGITDKVKFLDLQLSRWARPTIDLAYFFGSSTRPEWRRDNLEHMLRIYYNHLITSLYKFGYGELTYTWKDLNRDYRECYPFSFSVASMHTMVQLANPDNEEAAFDPDIDVETEENMKKTIEKFKDGQMKEARQNKMLRNTLIGIAEEGKAMGLY